MTFTYETNAPTPIDCHQERRDASVTTPHIEETPCMVIPAVAIARLWQSRIARTWMT